MAAPGSLTARYERVAGPFERRQELYFARKHLGFSIDEWRALPWWQRRVYIEGAQEEAESRQAAADGREPGPSSAINGAGVDPRLAAIYGGSLAEVAATGGFAVG